MTRKQTLSADGHSSATSTKQQQQQQQGARCALCGYEPTGTTDRLRTLGVAPLVVLVCSDQGACVTRFAQ